MDEESRVQPVLDLLGDDDFAPLAQRALRHYLDWNELLNSPLPAGLTAIDTWNAITAIRRLSALHHPFTDTQGRRYWFTITSEAIECLETIERHCRSDSQLNHSATKREGRRFLVRSRIREAIASCQLDGVEIPYEQVGRMLHEGASPKTAVEQLVRNSHDLLAEMAQLVAEPFTPQMIRSLYERVIQGVDLSELKRGEPRYNLPNVAEGPSLTPKQLEEAFDLFCQYANGEIGDPQEPVAIKAYTLIGTFGFWHPMPDFNGIVARCILRTFALKHDYPVLGYLPISRMMYDWAHGEIGPPTVRYWQKDAPGMGDTPERDYTSDVITFLQLTVAAIEDLRAFIRETKEQDDTLLGTLESDQDLNYRQRSVISRALLHPNAEFRIKYHQTTHRVVYATARADLLDLVDRGYLRQEQRGRAFVFVPVDDLEEKIGKP